MIMRHRRRQRAPSHERWLVSYADFITLLFAFFVVMYSAAQTDRKKVAQLAAAIRIAFQQYGALPSASVIQSQAQLAASPLPQPPIISNPADDRDLADLRKELEQSLADEISRGEVALRSSPEGLVISLREIGFFDSGSAGIKAASQPAFARMASLLRGRNRPIRIEGYTDNVPIHNSQFNSNWELSTARATEMIRVLITRYDFSPESLSAAGYGEYHPVASNRNEAGRAQNRRVDVVILRKIPGSLPAGTSSATQIPTPATQ
jgi:chemotaxis protein MotB